MNNDYIPEEMMEEEEDGIIVLTDEEGNDTPFAVLDVIEFDGDSYVVLLPEEELSSDSQEVGGIVILRVDVSENDAEYAEFVGVEDEDTLHRIIDIFEERNADVFDVIDESADAE